MKDIVWTNKTLSFKANYEIFNNANILLQIMLSDINGKDVSGNLTSGEVWKTGQEYLDMYTPKYLQGKNTTVMLGLNYGF
jgi:hypothetical protein